MYHRLTASDFLRFVVIGFCGFLTNYIVLIVLFDLIKLPILAAQIVGAEIALLTTFTGNNYWAFRDHHHISVRKKLLKYHVTSGAAICITTTTVVLLVRYGHLYYGLALVIAAAIGMIWNYLFNSKVIFKKLRKPL